MCVLIYERLFYSRFLTFELDIILENLDDLSSHQICISSQVETTSRVGVLHDREETS